MELQNIQCSFTFYTHNNQTGSATFKTWEFPICEKGSPNTFFFASRSTWSPASMLLGNIQELRSLSPKSLRQQERRERLRHWTSLSVSFSPQREHSVQLSSPPSEDLSYFQALASDLLSQCPHDRGWSPAVAPHGTTAESLCSVGHSPSRPPRISLSQ